MGGGFGDRRGLCGGGGARTGADGDLEEIVVTARKRDESLQNVPITVSVFTAQEIQAAGIESPRDFIAMVPNMTLVETQNVGNSFISIRGISQARNSEPSVAVLVDGVLETNPYEFNQELFDVKQIEVLKGPQGALYGRDAIGGAIIITTADPSDKFEGSTRVGVGNGIAEKAQVAVSGPIDSAGTLRYRASLNFYDTDGYLQNVYLDRKADPYRDYAARLRLVWKPNDAFSADLRFSYDLARTTAYYYVIPRSSEANPFSDFTTPGDANNISSPIQNNNLGTDNRTIEDRAEARLQPGIRNAHLGLGLQSHQGNRHRRCVRFSARWQPRSKQLSPGACRRLSAALSTRARANSSTSRPGARNCASRRPRWRASRGSAACTSCTPSASFRRVILRTGATAFRPSIKIPLSIPRILTRPTPTRRSWPTARTTTLCSIRRRDLRNHATVGIRCGPAL
jgi:outer membrane receptor protein involved in Fe transport